jgi:hypothetical protein
MLARGLAVDTINRSGSFTKQSLLELITAS